MESPKEQNFYEQLQLLEYISIAGILSIITPKIKGIAETIAFTAYHLNGILRMAFHFMM